VLQAVGGTIKGQTADITGETYTGGWFRTRGDSGWYNEKWVGGWYMSDPTWVRSYANKSVYTGGEMRGGTLRSEGRTTVGEYLQLGGVATEGTACSPNGLVGRNAAGLTLSCQSGVWRGGGITSAATVIRVGNPCGCATNEIRTGCSGKQSSSYDTYAVEPNLCYGEGGPAQCICARFE